MINIEPETHQWLLESANEKGEAVADFVGQVLDSLMVDWTPPESEESPERRVFWALVELKRDQRKRNRVYHAATLYAENPTDKAADLLAQMCEDAGLDLKRVKKDVGDDPFSSIIAFSRNGTKFGDCIQWLPKMLREHDGQVPVAILRALADRQGFKPSMLDRVKQAINDDNKTPAIVSVKVGKGWAWKVEGEQQQQQQQ